MIKRESHKCLGTDSPGFALWRQLLYRANRFQQEKLLSNYNIASQLPIHLRSYWIVRNELLEEPYAESDLDSEFIESVALLDDQRIIYLTSKGYIKIWNLHTSTLEQMINIPVLSIAVLDKNTIVFTRLSALNILDLYTSEIKELFSFSHRINHFGILDTEHVITCGDDTFEILNLNTGLVELTFSMHKSDMEIYRLIVLDQDHIISVSDESISRIWNLKTYDVERTLIGNPSIIPSFAALAENRVISNFDGNFKISNMKTMEVEKVLGDIPNDMNVTLLDEDHIVTFHESLNIWNLKTGKLEQAVSSESFSGHRRCIYELNLIGQEYIISNSEDEVKVWDLKTGTVKQILNVEGVPFLSILNENHIIYSNGSLNIWNRITDQVERILDVNESIYKVLKLDESHVAYFQEESWGVFNLDSRKIEQTFAYNADQPNNVIVLDMQRIALGFPDSTIKIWNFQTGAVEQELIDTVKHGILAIAQLDTYHIISVSYDQTLKLWNLTTGQVKQTLTGHESWVNAVAVVDPQRIVSASDDGTLKVWDLTIGQVIASIGLDGAPQCVAVARQGGRTLVVAGDADGALYCLELVEPVAS